MSSRLLVHILITVLFLVASVSQIYAEANKPPKVLILHSYHHEFAWTDEIQQGISKAIWSAYPKAELYAEFMNTKRNPPEKVFPILKELYQRSFSGTRFDVIVVSDNNALDFMLKYRDELFPGVPVVYCGINNIKDYKFAPGSSYTGVSEDPDLASTISLALKLHPGTRKVAVISDNTETGDINLGLVRKVIPRFADTEFIELRRMSAEQLSERLKQLGNDTVVLNVSFLRDAAGRVFTPRESMEYIVRVSPRPVYTGWDYNMAPGAMGGRMLSGTVQGRNAGELANKILSGEKADALPMRESPTTYILNYEGMKKFGISESQLPAESVITGKPDTVLEKYGTYIFAGAGLIIAQCAIIALLLSNIRRRRLEVAARLSAENELRHSDELFRQLFQHSPVYVFVKEVTETESRVVRASENFEGMIGIPGSKMVGKTMSELFPEELAKGIIADDWAAVSGNRVVRVEEELNGRYYVSIKFPLSHDEKRLLAGYTIDVTERKLGEKALLYSNALLNASLESTADGILIVDRDGKVVRWNQKFADLWHLPENLFESGMDEKILEHAMNQLSRPEEFLAKVRHLYSHPEESSLDLLELADGRLLERNSQPLRINDEIVARFWSFRDITEREEHEKEHLKIEKLESLGVLAGGIAHDFNNILTGIMGNISFARLLMDESHKSFKPLGEAEKATVRAGDLARQLLTFARGGEPVKKVILVRNLLNEAMNLVLRGSNVKGAIEQAADLYAVEADEGQLNQVFTNIIINATQAMPGGGNLRIMASNEQLESENRFELPPGRYVKIIFSDEGCGISPEVQLKIFDPYFTTKSAGNGLGLASAHSIVVRHGGAIRVSSIQGRGTDFTIYLPAVSEIQPVSPVDRGVGTPGNGAVIAGSKCGYLLVMDDEEIIRKLVASQLDFLGYQAATCSNGSEAIRLYRMAMENGKPFDAVIMDLTIPGGMGGKEAAAGLLAMHPQACLIVSSGYSADKAISDFRSFGFSGVIEKPYDVEKLSMVLSAVLHQNKAAH
jgi:PAS domain S-box-containing protein